MLCLPPRDTSPHQDSVGTARSSPLTALPRHSLAWERGDMIMIYLPPRDLLRPSLAWEPGEMRMLCLPPRDTSPHQDSAGTAPSGTPPPAQPPPPPQTRGTQSHRAPTPLKWSMLTPKGEGRRERRRGVPSWVPSPPPLLIARLRPFPAWERGDSRRGVPSGVP